MEVDVHSRAGADGSVDVWCQGWHARFPPDLERPQVERGVAPAEVTGNEVPVHAAPIGEGVGVGHGAWVIMFGPDEPRILSPEGHGDSLVRYYRMPHT